MTQRLRLAVFTTHPIQYQVPVWRSLAADPELEVRVFFGSDFSVRGDVDQEFGVRFAWDMPMTEGYTREFLIADPTVRSAGQLHLKAAQIKARVARFAPHVALLCGYAPTSFYWPLIRYLRGVDIPLLLRGEVTDADQARPLPKRLVRAVVLYVLYHRFSGLLVIGENARRHYYACGVPAAKTYWSPYNVNTDWFDQQVQRWEPQRDAVRRSLGFAPDQPVFIFSGKLIPKKDPLILPDALRLLVEQSGLAPGLIVLGDGELRRALEDALAVLPQIKAVLAGFQNQREVGRYYAAADCLILPSRWGETWGLVVNEALQFGLPAIVSERVGCWPDLIVEGQTGSVFPPGNPSALACCMQSMLAALSASKDTVRTVCRQKVAQYSTKHAAAGIRHAALAVSK